MPRSTGKSSREEGEKELSTDTYISIFILNFLYFNGRSFSMCPKSEFEQFSTAVVVLIGLCGIILVAVGYRSRATLRLHRSLWEAIHHLGSGLVSSAALVSQSSLRSHTEPVYSSHKLHLCRRMCSLDDCSPQGRVLFNL